MSKPSYLPDTNVLIRFLAKDHEADFEKARKLAQGITNRVWAVHELLGGF